MGWDWFLEREACPRSCDSFDFDQVSIEYALVNLNRRRVSKRYSSMIWKMAEEPTMVMEEEASYPAYAFFADVGGSLGLFLGLNVISVLDHLCQILSEIRRCCSRLGSRILMKATQQLNN